MDNYHPYDLVPTADYPGSAMLEFFRDDQRNIINGIRTDSSFFSDIPHTFAGLYRAITKKPLEAIPDMAMFGGQLLYFATFGVHDAAYKVVKQQAYNLYHSPAEAAIVAALGLTLYNDDQVKTAGKAFLNALSADFLGGEQFKDAKFDDPAGITNLWHIPNGVYRTYKDYTQQWIIFLQAVAASKHIPTITAAAAAAIVKDIHLQNRAKQS